MLKLDRSRPFGVISPPYTGESDELDRAAHFEQQHGGRSCLFDALGIEIVRGQPIKRKPTAPQRQEVSPLGGPEPADKDAIRSPGELLTREKELRLSTLRRRAAIILGELGEPFSPTASREEILDALEEARNTQRRLR